jgi:hypothetical protein
MALCLLHLGLGVLGISNEGNHLGVEVLDDGVSDALRTDFASEEVVLLQDSLLSLDGTLHLTHLFTPYYVANEVSRVQRPLNFDLRTAEALGILRRRFESCELGGADDGLGVL